MPDAAEKLERLGAWYDAFAPGLFRFAAGMLGDAGEAEEVLQEVFVRLAAGMRSGSIPREPERYLYRAVRNGCYSRLRWRRWHWIRRVLLREETLEAQGGSPETGDAAMLLEQLPGNQRAVVVMKVFEERTFAEIGELLNISTNTAASRYRYAMEKLRRTAGQDHAVAGSRREAGERP